MSVIKYVETKEYIVTLKNFEDLDQFYQDMETPGGTLYIPNRSIPCTDRRPTSRNTFYMLTEWEAAELRGDERVAVIELHPRYLGIKAGTFATTTQTSTNWNKSGTTNNAMLNWALLRCTEGVDRSGWGSDGTANATGTVNITSTGKNVDVVVVDAGNPNVAHPEYAVNADGTGGSRMISYNWYQHNPAVTGGDAGTYALPTHSHSVHVAGTVAGNTQGWARDANIYNIYYDAGDSGNFSYVFDYVREFHKTKAVNTATNRKNPTITNNSWGQSIFPGDWSFSDITAVTYRGTRYTPSGATTYNGFSGVCAAGERLATLAGFENFGNRITTAGAVPGGTGSIVTKPESWFQEGDQAYLTIVTAPDAAYTVTVQGPANISVINNVALSPFAGSASLTSDVNVAEGGSITNITIDTPLTRSDGGDYLTPANVSIQFALPSTGGGYGSNRATGTPVITNGKLSGITIVSGGSGYTKSTAVGLLNGQVLCDIFVIDSTSGSPDTRELRDITTTGFDVIASDVETIGYFLQGPVTGAEGVTIETDIRETLVLPNNAIYTLLFTTSYETTDPDTTTFAAALSVTVNNTASPATATVSSITPSILGAASLASLTTPTIGSQDDGYWDITLPWNVTYLGTTYNHVFVGTNFYLTFGEGSAVYTNLSATTPNIPKIMMCAADRSAQRIYYGEEGTAPNRTYRVRLEGHTAYSGGVLGSPTMVCEYVFYENNPTQIDLQIGANNAKTTGSGFTTEQLNDWGFISDQRIPARVAACDADIETAMSEGIIFVGAAGNGKWKHDLPGGTDWDNTFEMGIRYPESVTSPYYYMRGTSPTANDVNMPNICVGAIDVTTADYKSYYSDCGPGVDIWAPGTNIISSYLSGVSDSRNSGHLLGKISGTSMASPNVCGVLACALEQNPHWNQTQAKAYITGTATQGQITNTSGGPADIRDLQGAPNKYLYYKKERPETGTMVPRVAQGARPSTGMVFPRPRIYRFGK